MLLTIIGLPGKAVGQTRTTVTYKLTINADDFNTTSYAANNNEKTSDAVCTTDNTKTYEVKWTSYQVMKNSTNMQWQKSKGYIYNSTDLGTITSVTVTSSAGSFTTYYGDSEQPSSGSSGAGKGYFKTSVGGATGTTSKMEVTFQIEEGGSTTTATTTTINATGITNTNLYNGTAAGSLSASVTVTSGGAAVTGATVSWTSSNTTVADIASNGAVTLKATGNTTITAAYAGDATYSASSDTYDLIVINENPDLKTIWSENFSSYSEDDVPTGGDYSYACEDGTSDTKIYDANLAGGAEPELLVGKGGGSFTATIPLLHPTYGYSGDLILTFKANNTNVSVSTTTTGVTITGSIASGTNTFTLSGVTTITENIVISFTNSNSSNVRIDDIVLKGLQAELTTVATPVISPAGGAVVSGRDITITCATEGASIYYTMGANPADPTSSSTLYNPANKPTITAATTIKAIAIKKDWTNSAVASADYTIALPCATPTISPAAGEVESGTEVTITCATEGASIYYTMGANPADPTSSSTLYNSSSKPTITTATTIKAIAVKDGNANSEVASAAYNIIDYASLTEDFTYDGNGKNDLPTGLTAYNLGSGYASSPKMQFENKNSNISSLILKLGEAPISISYDIKGNSFSGGTFKVQLSEDGSNYEDLAVYSTLGDKQSVTHICNNSDVRYIKWIYTNKSSGNVGLGNINVTKSATINDLTITSSKKYTVESGAVLTLTGTVSNDYPANLIIEDGGQLKVSSKGVQATFKKTISQSTRSSAWNTISSPVGTIDDVTTVTNLVTGADLQYNLYRYNETKPSGQWEAYDEDDFTTLEKGRGYLYRNNGKEIAFAGEVNTTSATVNLTASNTALPQLKGFNLIGNPFGEDITMDDIDNESFTGGYVITNDGKWSASPVLTIQPCQGFLVQVDNPETITINKPVSKGTTYNKEYIKFIVANSQYEDAAFALFEKGYGLNKINHRNADIPMLYINKDNRDLAIATMSDDTKSFNLNFKAMTMGQYTLSYKATGEYSYLHVIDRFTGEDVDMLLEGEYKFVATPNDNEARFIVKLGYMPDYSDVENDIFAYQNGSEILVSGEGELQIFDVTGRNVMTTMINGAESINIPAKGVYIFRLVGKEIKTQKIVVR